MGVLGVGAVGNHLSTRVMAVRPTADPRSNDSFVSLFIHSYKREMLSISSIPGMVLGPGDTEVRETET